MPKFDDHGLALVMTAFRAVGSLTRILPALDTDAEAVGCLGRSHHVDSPHHQILVHVEVMVVLVVLLRTTCGAGHGTPPPSPRVVSHLVTRTTAASRPKVPQHLLRGDGLFLSVRARVVVMVMVLVRPGVAERGGGAQVGAARVLARRRSGGGTFHDGVGSSGWGVVETRAPAGGAASPGVQNVLSLITPGSVDGLVGGL
jgi:hypothetical protein